MSALPSTRNLALTYAAATLRSLGTGFMGVVLGVYLYRQGFSSTAIGVVIAAGIAGTAVATTLVSFRGDHMGRRPTLITLSLLSAVGALGLAFANHLLLLLPVAFLGMLNATGTDRSAAFALDQAVIPGLVPDARRTWALAWYNVLLDGGGALGALAAGLPLWIHHWIGLSLTSAYRISFLAYAALNLLSAGSYTFLSHEVEISRSAAMKGISSLSGESRSILSRLVGLFFLDSFGGGFLTDALVAYWFFRRFGIAEQNLGFLFFAVHILNAVSHLGAAWLARRIGLVNTMVFTHLPSSIFLIAVPFAPSVRLAVIFFLLRESLVEMDVPTRQSYVAAVVKPEERTFASGATNLVRNVAWAASSSIAGALMKDVFSAPLVLGGSFKIIYDLLLFRNFRRVKPPEEREKR